MKFKTLTILSFSLCLMLPSPAAFSQGTLKGGVLQEDINRQPAPSLDRKHIQGDPFGSAPEDNPVDQLLEAPPGSFEVDTPKAAPPKKPFNLNVQDQGQGVFSGEQMPGSEDTMPTTPPPVQKNPLRNGVQQTAPRNNEPDSSAEMQLLWDAWHKRVAESIYMRYNGLAQMAFKASPPLMCQVSYCVARDGRIGNVRILQKSPNPMYNAMLLGVINSMTNNPVLEFPPNSRRQYVEKTGTFTWNYGNEGYKHMINDRETVQQGQPRQQQMQQPQQMQQQQMRPMQQMMPMMR